MIIDHHIFLPIKQMQMAGAGMTSQLLEEVRGERGGANNGGELSGTVVHPGKVTGISINRRYKRESAIFQGSL